MDTPGSTGRDPKSMRADRKTSASGYVTEGVSSQPASFCGRKNLGFGGGGSADAVSDGKRNFAKSGTGTGARRGLFSPGRGGSCFRYGGGSASVPLLSLIHIFINPLHTNLYRKSLSLRKTKTDKVDSRTIATMMMSEMCIRDSLRSVRLLSFLNSFPTSNRTSWRPDSDQR